MALKHLKDDLKFSNWSDAHPDAIIGKSLFDYIVVAQKDSCPEDKLVQMLEFHLDAFVSAAERYKRLLQKQED